MVLTYGTANGKIITYGTTYGTYSTVLRYGTLSRLLTSVQVLPVVSLQWPELPRQGRSPSHLRITTSQSRGGRGEGEREEDGSASFSHDAPSRIRDPTPSYSLVHSPLIRQVPLPTETDRPQPARSSFEEAPGCSAGAVQEPGAGQGPAFQVGRASLTDEGLRKATAVTSCCAWRG